MVYQELPVFAAVYALTLRIFTVTQDFPREYNFTLGSDTKQDVLVRADHRRLRRLWEGQNLQN